MPNCNCTICNRRIAELEAALAAAEQKVADAEWFNTGNTGITVSKEFNGNWYWCLLSINKAMPSRSTFWEALHDARLYMEGRPVAERAARAEAKLELEASDQVKQADKEGRAV